MQKIKQQEAWARDLETYLEQMAEDTATLELDCSQGTSASCLGQPDIQVGVQAWIQQEDQPWISAAAPSSLCPSSAPASLHEARFYQPVLNIRDNYSTGKDTCICRMKVMSDSDLQSFDLF